MVLGVPNLVGVAEGGGVGVIGGGVGDIGGGVGDIGGGVGLDVAFLTKMTGFALACFRAAENP